MKKEYRIKNNEEIASIVKKRNRVGNEYLVIYYQKGTTNSRVAISVSKKYGCAVLRNHAKRLVRETLRDKIMNCSSIDIVVVVKNEFKNLKFDELSHHMDYFIKKIVKRLYN